MPQLHPCRRAGAALGGHGQGVVSHRRSSDCEPRPHPIAPQCIAIALNANGNPGRFAGLDVPIFGDPFADFLGPLAGVLAGMDWAVQIRAPAVFTIAVDTPFSPENLATGLEAAVALRDDLRAALDGGLRKIRQWTEQHGAGVAQWVSEPYDPFFNINTRADAIRAETLLALQA